jgi:hypothetical protein
MYNINIIAATLHMTKTEIYAIDGHDFEIICKSSAPIKKCIFQFEKSKVDLPDGYTDIFKHSYVGTGFENGDCGVEIKGKWDMQGKISCSVQLKEDDQILTSSGKIIMDDSPGTAILEFNAPSHILQFNESQPMNFSCRAQYGKFSQAKLLVGEQFLEIFLTNG